MTTGGYNQGEKSALNEVREGWCFYNGMVPLTSFFQTMVYRDFESFCEHCRRAGSIGVVYGAAGVGKTLAVCGYTQWDRIKSLLTYQGS